MTSSTNLCDALLPKASPQWMESYFASSGSEGKKTFRDCKQCNSRTSCSHHCPIPSPQWHNVEASTGISPCRKMEFMHSLSLQTTCTTPALHQALLATTTTKNSHQHPLHDVRLGPSAISEDHHIPMHAPSSDSRETY